MPPLAFFSALAITAALTAVSTVVAVSPAQATEQSFFGTTGDVLAPAALVGNDKLIGSTAYVPSTGGTLQPYIATPIATDMPVTISRVGGTVGTCTIYAGGTWCNINTGTSLPAGATAVTVRFATAGSTADFAGTVFSVVETYPTFSMEWQDAAGTWIVGSGGPAVPIMGTTALRCTIINNSNGDIIWRSLNLNGTLLPSGSVSIPIRETLAGGTTGHYDVYSGSVFGIAAGSCSGGGQLPTGSGVGNGTGLGVIAVSGTIDVDQTPAPGTTVTITGDGVYTGTAGSYAVLLDDVALDESPVSTTAPDYDFSVDVDVPSDLEPGEHMLKVVETASGKNVAFAAFPFTVPEPPAAEPPAAELPAADVGSTLASTGQALPVSVLVGASTVSALVIAAGAALIISARRRRQPN
jgi:hypothetical protein